MFCDSPKLSRSESGCHDFDLQFFTNRANFGFKVLIKYLIMQILRRMFFLLTQDLQASKRRTFFYTDLRPCEEGAIKFRPALSRLLGWRTKQILGGNGKWRSCTTSTIVACIFLAWFPSFTCFVGVFASAIASHLTYSLRGTCFTSIHTSGAH